jgi:putative DNA primase/helicase
MITELAPEWAAEPLILPNEDKPPKDSKQTTEITSWLTTIDTATVRSSALASLTLKQRSPLLDDWLCEGDYGIIFASRGVGKTWFGLLIAKAVATGGRLGEWKAPEPVRVLYVDGEMPPDLMRDRDRGLGSGEVEFLNHEILFDRTEKVLNITEPAVQEAILQKCIRDNIKLVMLDNLSTLVSGVKENDSFEWERLHNWLLHFRRRKIAVVLIHHAGRSGEMRGTSKREDAAFWVILLNDGKKHADDKRGARFISIFTKPSRNIQDEVPSYEWHVVTDPVTGEVSVACKPAQTLDVLRQLIEDGVTECNQLAQEMRVTPGTISKWAKKAMKEGWLTKSGREYVIVETGNEVNEGKRK